MDAEIDVLDNAALKLSDQAGNQEAPSASQKEESE
ncbi:hypothetical protein PC116_g29699 [Phytophthora cactorum]|nr:hypothetical protein PC116_g29699 [Phytophthora cactorum]